jgi:hypothetical protein
MFRLRLIRLLVLWFLRSKKNLLDAHTLSLRAWPIIDIDVSKMFAHSFTRAMILGRYQLIFASELRNICLKKRWFPVVTSDLMSVYKPIYMFEKFELVSKLVGWNDRRFYSEQIFMVKGQVRARCLAEGVIGGPEGFLNPTVAFSLIGDNRVSPELPEEFKLWIELKRKIKEIKKN